MYDCLIVGGGIAGLMAGYRLNQAGRNVAVLDKGRGIGGRLATRRVNGPDGAMFRFDYGAQYFTVSDDRFFSVVQSWKKRNIIRGWSESFPGISGGKAGNRMCYIGINGIREIAKDLSAHLDTHVSTQVTGIDYHNSLWVIETDDGARFEGKSLIMTPPVPQTLELLSTFPYDFPDHELSALRELKYLPCFALLVLLESESGIPQPGGIFGDDKIIRWMSDNHKKGISPQGAGVTIHASADFSREQFDTPSEQVSDMLIDAASDWLNGQVINWQLHRWRYSQPLNPLDISIFQLSAPAPLILAGDIFSGGRVESAALSGFTAGEQMLAYL